MVENNLPTYIPLEEAATRYNIPLETLRRAVENNQIRAIWSIEESEEIAMELAVAEDDVASMEQEPQKTPPAFISLEKATQRYNVPVNVLIEAVDRGAIKAVKVGNIVKISESDVSIVAAQVQKRQDNDELVSISEAARRLGLPSGTVFQWHEHGWLPVLALGIRRAKLVSWNQAQALGQLRQDRNSGRGSRLIPKVQDLAAFSAS